MHLSSNKRLHSRKQLHMSKGADSTASRDRCSANVQFLRQTRHRPLRRRVDGRKGQALRSLLPRKKHRAAKTGLVVSFSRRRWRLERKHCTLIHSCQLNNAAQQQQLHVYPRRSLQLPTLDYRDLILVILGSTRRYPAEVSRIQMPPPGGVHGPRQKRRRYPQQPYQRSFY